MLTLINTIADRCFFTITFILGVQLPEFMQQYQQRLAGHLSEAQLQLSQFEAIAQQHFEGSVVTMISRYKENNEASIVSTGELIENLMMRTQYLTRHLEELIADDYLQSVYRFILHIDRQIAAGTAEQFAMAIPLTLPALATGATLAISSLILKELLVIAVKCPFRAKKTVI